MVDETRWMFSVDVFAEEEEEVSAENQSSATGMMRPYIDRHGQSAGQIESTHLENGRLSERHRRMCIHKNIDGILLLEAIRR
jgi:hypothetical protein